MSDNRVCALIVSQPGPLRDGLRALLSAMPQIEVIGEASDIALVSRMIQEHCPTLVLLDADLPGNEVGNTLKTIKANGPEVRCIVLASTIEQQQAAQLAGADSAPLKGFLAEKLYTTLEKLLS
jgi:DNA-binding NarL/FixJ family response regulator